MKMESTSKISIIMPTFNRGHLIADTIKSVCDQTYANWELIIVDDGSADNTENVVQQFDDQRIQFYKAGRIGIGGRIKNIGIQKASGELIAFIDSDDLWANTKLEKQLAAMQQYPEAGFCITGGYNFREPGIPTEFFYKQVNGLMYDSIFIAIFRSEIAVFTQALLFWKHCIDKAGFFREEGSFSDVDFVLNLAYHYKAVVLYEPLVYRRLHDENYITPTWEKSYQESVALIGRYRNKGMISSALSKHARYRLYINWGEKCLLYKKGKTAMSRFVKAWVNKPFSMIPARKIAKAIWYSFK